jgi:hypothetical protein
MSAKSESGWMMLVVTTKALVFHVSVLIALFSDPSAGNG